MAIAAMIEAAGAAAVVVGAAEVMIAPVPTGAGFSLPAAVAEAVEAVSMPMAASHLGAAATAGVVAAGSLIAACAVDGAKAVVAMAADAEAVASNPASLRGRLRMCPCPPCRRRRRLGCVCSVG